MQWFTVWLIILVSLLYPMMARSDTLPHPQLQYYRDWVAHRSLGVVLLYKVDGRRVEFAHALIAAEPAPECSAVNFTGPVWHVMVLGESPIRYQIRSYATAYRYPPGEWISLIERTHYEKGAEGQTEAQTEAE